MSEVPKREQPRRRVAYLLFALAVGAALMTTLALQKQPEVPREAAFMAGIFVLAGLLWVTEALPLFATALLVIGMEIILLANPGAWAGFGFAAGESPPFQKILHAAADPVLLLFFGGFLLAQSAVKEGVDKAVSSLLLKPFERRARWLLLGILSIAALFSMWMSNTAAAAMMITLVGPIIAQLPADEPFRKALVLAVPIGANLGGIGTPIASPPNAVAVGFLRNMGHPVGFLQWMLVAVPLMIGLIAFSWLLLWLLFHPKSRDLRFQPAPQHLGARGWYVVGVFTVTVRLWLSEQWHGLPASVVALLPAIALTAPGILTRDDVNGLHWNILILIGGGIALGAGMQMSGLDQVIVRQLPATGAGGAWLIVAFVAATVGIGTFMSNTAAANLLRPIGISAAAAAGHAPVQMAISIALAASMSMALPISTPPNAIAYASGEFTTRELARSGIIIGGAATLLIVLFGGAMMKFWGLL